MAYGEPITLGIVGGILAIAGVVAGDQATKKDAKEAEKAKEKAEKEEKKAKKEQERQEAIQRTAEASSGAVDTEIALRERLHLAKVAQSDAKTAYVDEYRAQLGFVGDEYDQVLSNLYSQQRQVALEQQRQALEAEKKEIKEIEGTNYGQIALYSFLGLASVGTLVYLKNRNQ